MRQSPSSQAGRFSSAPSTPLPRSGFVQSAPSALRLLERPEARVDLLFSDVVLPGGMTGPQLVEAARALRPRLRVLFTTGYARNAHVHHGRREVGVDLITKPFSYADLAAKVRDVLDGA